MEAIGEWGDPDCFSPDSMRKGFAIDTGVLARRVVDLAEDKQAHDIVLLDIRKQTTIAEYFVLCSADNDRQIKAIVDHVDEHIHKEFDYHPRIEGEIASGWVVLDYASVVVHIFRTDQREYYQLERLWNKATPVVVVQ